MGDVLYVAAYALSMCPDVEQILRANDEVRCLACRGSGKIICGGCAGQR
jgi:hypothetical protein